MSKNINGLLTFILNEHLNSLFLAHFNILSFHWAGVALLLAGAQSLEHSLKFNLEAIKN